MLRAELTGATPKTLWNWPTRRVSISAPIRTKEYHHWLYCTQPHHGRCDSRAQKATIVAVSKYLWSWWPDIEVLLEKKKKKSHMLMILPDSRNSWNDKKMAAVSLMLSKSQVRVYSRLNLIHCQKLDGRESERWFLAFQLTRKKWDA